MRAPAQRSPQPAEIGRRGAKSPERGTRAGQFRNSEFTWYVMTEASRDALLRRHSVYSFAVQENLSLARREHAGEQMDERALPAPFGPISA